MGYSFRIGEGKWNSKEKMCCVSVHGEDAAPVFEGDYLTENRNERHPSYSGWYEFCRATGLYDLFFSDKDRLIPEEPGSVRLNLRHLKVVREAVDRFKEVHGCENSAEPASDANYVRLIWLEWWINWALRNCKNPTFQNT